MTLNLQAGPILLRDWVYDDLEPYADWLQPGHRWQQIDGPYEPAMTPVEIEEQIARIGTVS